MAEHFHLKVTIPSDLKFLSVVGNTFETFFNHTTLFSFSENDFGYKLNLALTEAVTNAIAHGNKEDETHTVQITARIEDQVLIIEVEDTGVGFELKEMREEVDVLSDSGRGIYIIKEIMDIVDNRLSDGSHILTMKKHF